MTRSKPIHQITTRCVFASILALVLSSSSVAADTVDLSRLEWLEGHWSGVEDGVRSEEFWSSPSGNGLIGMHKDVRDERMSGFEFFRIVGRGDSVCYLASPAGAAPTAFCATELGERRVVFGNPAHDFPQRVLYWLDERGRLHARIEGELGGSTRAKEWIWERQSGRHQRE